MSRVGGPSLSTKIQHGQRDEPDEEGTDGACHDADVIFIGRMGCDSNRVFCTAV